MEIINSKNTEETAQRLEYKTKKDNRKILINLGNSKFNEDEFYDYELLTGLIL